jgi:hypothetical protein
MSLLCSSDCGEVTVTLNPNYSPCEFEKRNWGYSKIVRLKCDTVFTDITDPSEWESKITSGEISVSPVSLVDIGEPTSTVLITSGCGEESPGSQEYPINVESYRTKSDLSDYAFYKELESNITNTRLVLVDCNGIFHLDDDYIAGIRGQGDSNPPDLSVLNPGFAYSLTRVPQFIQQDGPGKTGKWVYNLKIITTGMLDGILLPGVYSVL